MQTSEATIEAPKPQSHRSRAEWFEEAKKWRATGQSAAEYAAEHGLNADTLAWWASRLKVPASRPERKPLIKDIKPADRPPMFVPLHVVEGAAGTTATEPAVDRRSPSEKQPTVETRTLATRHTDPACEIEIVLLNGRRIRVGAGVDEAVLERVLKVAEGGVRC